ncbi:hypothetical protein IFM89_023883 [Coptis chinensis]|uniref:CASP-like protein n=1 Tax=Coptis chinensis TaxID=261450 RepID=A0A835IDD3_9MAGN|nr:hypothetical protein IFM89_023883 [Coptis chinensis]
MMNGRKTTPDVGIQMPETKVSATESVTMSGPLMSNATDRKLLRKTDVAHVLLRLMCLLSSVLAVAVMATSEEKANITIYGFSLPVYSKWSFAPSFE